MSLLSQTTKGSSMSLSSLHENESVRDYVASRNFSGFSLVSERRKITLYTDDPTIISLLQQARVISDTNKETIELDVATIIPKRLQLKKAARESRLQYDEEINDLLEALNSINAFSDPAVKQRINVGHVQYNDLPVLFARGTEIIAEMPDGLLGGVVDSCSEVSTFFGSYFIVNASIILPTCKGCCLGKISHKIPSFDGNVVPVNKLNVRPITTAEKEKLIDRGKVFSEFTKEPKPANYTGMLTIHTWFREKVLGADGRVMVDPYNFAQIESDEYYEMMRQFKIDENVSGSVKEDDLWRCYHRIHGFSMRIKRWGWLNVDGLSSVKWREDAFDNLVLGQEHKDAVYNLVKNYQDAFADFVDNKSGGIVFLLHGPTGVGKTLSAEAVAETLHRPLYSVSVGELGTTPNELEERLRSILDLAYQWNAVLLLDEADIFMEARDTNNIQRNAMVSIFLRLLEYYSGVLFLTTNRVETFDKAFFSRISYAINYPNLDPLNRKHVWNNVLKAAGVSTDKLDLESLSTYNTNGRNIKTAVRLAQTFAKGDKRPVMQKDFENILKMMENFNKTKIN